MKKEIDLFLKLVSPPPNNLEECLKLFERVEYQSFGCGIVFLDYNYTFKHWSIAFRNPVNFTNPEIKEDTPLKAVHAMLAFLKTYAESKR